MPGLPGRPVFDRPRVAGPCEELYRPEDIHVFLEKQDRIVLPTLGQAPYPQPFDLLAKNTITLESKKPAERARTGISDKWLPFVNAYRTLCQAPDGDFRLMLEEVGDLLSARDESASGATA